MRGRTCFKWTEYRINDAFTPRVVVVDGTDVVEEGGTVVMMMGRLDGAAVEADVADEEDEEEDDEDDDEDDEATGESRSYTRDGDEGDEAAADAG